MKLQTGFPLTVALALGAPAAAQDVDASPDRLSFTPIGSFFSRYEVRRNYGPNQTTGVDHVRYRTRAGFDSTRASIGEGTTLRLRATAQSTGTWEIGGDTLDDPGLGLHEGFVELGSGAVRVELGRFEMAYGDQLVIGNVDWSPSGRAFDGVRVHHRRGPASPGVDVFATYLEEGAGTSATMGDDFGEGDTVFGGVYAMLGPLLPEPMQLDVYALSRVSPGTSAPELDRPATGDATLGVRSVHRAGVVDYRAEGGLQFGGRVLADGSDTRGARAHQVDVEVGANLAGDRLRIAIEGFRASGDDPATRDDEGWAQLYPTAHKWLGLMDVIPGRTDVQGGVVHLTAKPTGRVSVGLDVHTFFHDRAPIDADRFRGAEADLTGAWTLGRGVGLKGMFGVFVPSADVGGEALYGGELELRVTLPLPD